MSTSLLVRHSTPFPTESLLGYVLRLTEENGYTSPWDVYKIAGMKGNEIKLRTFSLNKLAAIANRSETTFDGIKFSACNDKAGSYRLLGNSVVQTDLNIVRPHFCPQCVGKNGFIEAYWDLALMGACPIHRCIAASSCPKCGKPLSLFRRGLLECKCGGNLMEGTQLSITEAEATVVDMIRRKALGLPVSEGNSALFPIHDLMAMDLRYLLLVIRTLGKFRMFPANTVNRKHDWNAVSAASRVLTDWPENFILLLKDIASEPGAKGAHGIRSQFGGIYSALFKRKLTKDSDQFEFLKVPFLGFATSEWGGGYADRKMLKRVGNRMKVGYLTQSEFAARAGIGINTAARLLKSGVVPSRRVKWGKGVRVLVDPDDCVIARNPTGTVLSMTAAAKRMGIPRKLLCALKESRVFDMNSLVSRRGGIHELDLDSFTQKLLALAPPASETRQSTNQTKTLKSALSWVHFSTETKVSIFQALLARRLDVVGNSDGTIGGILIDSTAYRELLPEPPCVDAKTYLVPKEVSKILHCDQIVIPGLIQMGLLQGIRAPRGLRITAESVKVFKQTYICLATVAKEACTCSRSLVSVCREVGIAMISVPRCNVECAQPFIHVSDKARLLKASAQSSKSFKDKTAARSKEFFQTKRVWNSLKNEGEMRTNQTRLPEAA